MAPIGKSKESEKNPNIGGVGGHSVSNVTHALRGTDFPAQKQDLIKQAKQNHATKEAMQEIEQMEEKEYGSMADVMKDYGKHH
ncbi:DUF2795 domain-containing protein [Geomonas sp. RF6]|uniref:DUF2795 domain-containing protein n=1 Tax=Geomonas sp. RF6 TaxID=2897342 RepID=UPI001E583359|nr:DUF2795 domain-containing protein [Geomonas sp. RF6]UFS70697.1 DUF2795 domain-containing protein [Geomonas sp. RF6]